MDPSYTLVLVAFPSAKFQCTLKGISKEALSARF
jgi:hypothetical protein